MRIVDPSRQIGECRERTKSSTVAQIYDEGKDDDPRPLIENNTGNDSSRKEWEGERGKHPGIPPIEHRRKAIRQCRRIKPKRLHLRKIWRASSREKMAGKSDRNELQVCRADKSGGLPQFLQGRNGSDGAEQAMRKRNKGERSVLTD
jgi:hypothetical protein